MSIQDKIMGLSQNVPGALRVCVELYNDFGEQALDALEESGIRGSDIWLLYNDECGRDIAATQKALHEGTAADMVRDNPFSSMS